MHWKGLSEWYQKAAENGIENAMVNLTRFDEKDKNCSKNLSEQLNRLLSLVK